MDSWCELLSNPNCYSKIESSHPLGKEADEVFEEINKAFCDVFGDEDDAILKVEPTGTRHEVGNEERDFLIDIKCKKYGIRNTHKDDDHKDTIGQKVQKRVEDLSKEEQYEAKMRATQAKLRQSYQRTCKCSIDHVFNYSTAKTSIFMN